MGIQKHRFQVEASSEGQRLDQFLVEAFSSQNALSKAKVRKLIVAGAVYLNRKRVRIASKTVRVGAEVEVFLDLEKLNSREDPVWLMNSEDLIYEDEDLVVVRKPPGIPTQPTLDEARATVYSSLKKFLSHREQISDPYLALHHRLDRDTSGLLLFTKTKRINAAIGELFQKHQIRKTYWALTVRPSREVSSWTVENYLKREKRGKKTVVHSTRSGGDRAVTHFQVLKTYAQGLWVEAKPETGRMHQIRVHLSEGEMPIWGDQTYGGPSAERVMLHAQSLVFKHPIQKKEISLSCAPPEDFLSFQEKLASQ